MVRSTKLVLPSLDKLQNNFLLFRCGLCLYRWLYICVRPVHTTGTASNSSTRRKSINADYQSASHIMSARS